MTIDATAAVKKLSIWKPGTRAAANQRRATLIRKAKRPRERIVKGRAISCKTGRTKVLRTPITIAVTKVARRSIK